MTHPHRFEIRLRPVPDADGQFKIERRREDELEWRLIDLHPVTSLEDLEVEDIADFDGLIRRFEDLDKIESIESSLQLEQQRTIGGLLRRALFDDKNVPADKAWIHIIPSPAGAEMAKPKESDFLDFVLRLPWLLMTTSDKPGAEFLALGRLDPFAITVEGGFDLRAGPRPRVEVSLPPHPRLLLIVPLAEVPGQASTEGAAHLESLKQKLPAAYSDANRNALTLSHARTRSGVEAALGGDRPFNPHIVYFYGHAANVGQRTEMFLEPCGRASDGRLRIDEMERLLQSLVESTGHRPVVWINGCQSGIAPRASAIRSLAPHAAAVIATRTLAAVADARRLGETALRAMVEGHAPPIALRDAIARQSSDTVRSARWATPIVAVQYDRWTALGTRKVADLGVVSLGDVPRRLDRETPVGSIRSQLRASIDAKADRADIVIWRGPADQGVDVFERRFLDLVAEDFEDWSPIVRSVELNFDGKVNRSDAASGELDFKVSVLNALVSREDRLAKGRLDPKRLRDAINVVASAERSMLVLSNGHFDVSRRPLIERYVEFWKHFYKLLQIDGGRCRLVVAIGVQADEPLNLPDVQDWPLESVGAHDVATHVDQYNPAVYFFERPEEEVGRIVGKAGGRFTGLYQELERRLNATGEEP